MKGLALKILNSIATVMAALMLYAVIVLLQMPKHAQAMAAATVAPCLMEAPKRGC